MTFKRPDNRAHDELRPIRITRNYLMYPEGSVLIEQGNTKVIVTATVEQGVPKWMKDSNNAWITAEYSMLPRATDKRMSRDRNGRSTPGRSIEIQRLIGRSIRGAFNLEGLGEISIKIDCDVIQADGGTRCASITGAFIATFDAFKKALENGLISRFPDYSVTAAISCGIVEGTALLDLNYEEDSMADVDANFVMDENLNIIEVQATAEKHTFGKDRLMELLELAEKGISQITDLQKKILSITGK